MAHYFTSDTHFGHRNVIAYCKRPFLDGGGEPDLPLMNQELARRWNAVVQPEDTVYHLGDFAMGPRDELPGHRRQLNGHIVLVRGNHDRSTSAMRSAGFDEVCNELWLKVDGQDIWMRHIPPTTTQVAQLPRPCHLILCGHVHEEWRERGIQGVRTINVGVDQWDFTPQPLETLVR
jgi:calcineurin-like phosphoesterase family protein